MATGQGGNILSVDTIIDKGPVSGVAKRVVSLMFLVALIDSYDQSALAFAAPSLVKQWQIARAAMGPVFSAQMLGMMLGAIGFGYVGDRIGRKFAVVVGLFLFGVLSLATILVESVTGLMVLRFLVGLGVGGVMPGAVALSNEFFPRRQQVFAVTLMYIGYVCGGAGGGVIAAWLLPQYGWEILFIVGGLVPLVVAALLMVSLPESLRFLAASPVARHQIRAAAVAARIRPDLGIAPSTRIVSDDAARARVRVQDLFSGRLKIMTIFLWIVFVTASLTNFSLISWTPILIGEVGFSPKLAAVAMSLFFISSAPGGVLMGWIVDRKGVGPLIAVPVIGVPLVAVMGWLDPAQPAQLFIAAIVMGFFVPGFQNCLNGLGGAVYPTPIRAAGVGWALSVGKVGAMIGPVLAGAMLARGMPPSAIFSALGAPLLISALGLLGLQRVAAAERRQEAPAPALGQ